MNYLSQFLAAKRWEKVIKQTSQKIEDFREVGYGNYEINDKYLEFINVANKEYKNSLPILRNTFASFFKEFRKQLPFTPNEEWIEAEKYYFAIKAGGSLVAEKAEDLKGKWLTKYTDQGVFKGKRFAEYCLSGEYGEVKFIKDTFFCTYTHTDYCGEEKVRDNRNMFAYSVSQCRLATEEEIKLEKLNQLKDKKTRDLIAQKSEEITKLYSQIKKSI